MRGLMTSGRDGGTIWGFGGGAAGGVGSANPMPTALRRVSKASIVSGSFSDTRSIRWTPVEIPNGRTSRPALT